MTTRYVGIGGNNSNDGLSWANRKLTLNGVEDTPVVAGDTVYVGPGTYRELLTVDVSGSSGNPITYIGDYTGANTDGVGGVVRITGSDNDQTATRANAISGSSKNYRTFQGFAIDVTSGVGITNTSGTNWIIQSCYFDISIASTNLDFPGASQAACTVQNCYFNCRLGATALSFNHSVAVDNAGHTVQNCVFSSGTQGIVFTRVGGNTVKNCVFLNNVNGGVRVTAALTVGQTETVNNCIFHGCTTAIDATATGEVTENHNTFFNNGTNRNNTSTGANSLAYPALFDSRWFFQLVTEGAGPNHATQVVTPFDLSSISQLINVAGTSPTTTDMRGTAVQGSQREWGALEYDSTLKLEARHARARSLLGLG